jgi:dTDP-glucose 4,6-dehydratase
MRVLVTGGAGFIGSHLSRKLIEMGMEVICVDNLLTGDLSNIEDLLNRKGFSFLKHDITKPLYIEGEIHRVFHLASPASPKDYIRYPIQTLKAGAHGTHNSLGIALHKKARFLLASTSEVYGDPLEHPQKETYWGNVNPVGPRGVYDEAKRFAEALSMAYHRIHHLDVKIARIFNTYGPAMRLDDGRVIPNFIKQAMNDEPLTIYGDGEQTRSFCYIDDMIDGLLKLMESDYNGPVNLGNPEEWKIKDLANLVMEVTGKKLGIRYLPPPPDDPVRRQPDISLAKKILKWEPKVSLREGFKRTWEFFCERQKKEDITF